MRISAEDLCSLTPYSHLNLRHRVNPERICYVLAGVSKQASRYLRLKYVLEESQRYHVVYELAKRVYRKTQSRYQNPWMFMKLAEIAVDESLGNGLCKRCNGKGWIDTGIKRIDCFDCHGSGTRHSLDDASVAERIQAPLKWYRRYGKRALLQNMMGILSSYEGELHHAFQTRLY